MVHVLIAPLIFGIFVVVGGMLLLIFRRQIVELFPTYEQRGRGILPNSVLRVVLFGVIVSGLGLYFILANGLQLF